MILEARSMLIPFYTKFWVERVRFLVSTCTTSTPKLRAIFQRFQIEERILTLNKTTKFSFSKFINPKLDSSFNFFSFYDVIILAAIMITYPIMVFFISDEAYFENGAKGICGLKGTWSYQASKSKKGSWDLNFWDLSFLPQ